MPAPELIAYWPLKGNADDAAGQNHGLAQNVRYTDGPDGVSNGAAVFNGLDSLIRVDGSKVLNLGDCDFSISARIKCDLPMRSVFGDILSKYDPVRRCGVNFYVAGSSPGYNSMSDTRHVHFGIDDGYIGSWEDCGKPWLSDSFVPCLLVHRGDLYCGIADAENPADAAHIFHYAGGTEWIDCGRLGTDPNHLTVQSMIVHDDKIYAGTGIWDWHRAKGYLGDSFPTAPTHVFVYEGGTDWRDLGQVGEGTRVLCMGSFDGELYVGIDAMGGGRCFKYDGVKWIDCGAPDGRNMECFVPLGGTLYVATHGNIHRYEGGRKWTCIGSDPHGIEQIHSFQVFGGSLYIGTWPQGYVLRREAVNDWTIVGQLGLPKSENGKQFNEVMDLTVHNGKLYAGVIPKAEVYRYETDGQWTLLKSLAQRADWSLEDGDTWCRVPSLTSYQGRLFASTGSCRGRAVDAAADESLGRVFALQIGHVVSHEYDIGGDWTHIAAVRRGKELLLYVNGELSVASETPEVQSFDLANSKPLTIGFGAQGSFSGAIADVRLYAGAMDETQIRQLR